MKFVLILISVFLSFKVIAQIEVKGRSERKKEKFVVQKVNVKRMAPVRNKKNQEDQGLKIKEDEELTRMIRLAEMKPLIIDFTSSYKVKTGTVIRGRLLNSIRSTNIESPIDVEVLDDKYFPIGTKFICKGNTRFKRVETSCNRVVLPGDSDDEFKVRVRILNMDGTNGIKPDEIYNADSKYVVGAVAIEALKAAAIWDQTISTTAIGDRPVANDKNRLIGGLNGGLDAVGDIAEREFKTIEPIVVVYAGKEVLIRFDERLQK